MNTEQSARIKALFEKYKQNQCTPQEKARVEQWLGNLNKNSADTLVNENALLKRIRQNVAGQIGANQNHKTFKLTPFLKVAAMLLLVPVATYFYFSNHQSQPTLTRFITKRGEQKTLILPDSTEITLNSSSVLTLNTDFNQHDRRVSLSGEGYFHVKRNTAKPFIISTGRIQTRVLGTQFNVQAYPGDRDYKVAVASGRVQVSEAVANHIKPLSGVLTHDLMITYNNVTHQSYVGHTDADELSAWRSGKLYFEKASVSEIAKALSRKYNIDIQVNAKPGETCRYTVGFKNQALGDVLNVLHELTGLTYKRTNNTIIISSPNCN